MVRAFTSQSVDLGFNPLVEAYQKSLKNSNDSFLLGARHLKEVVENKPASSLVVSVSEALNGMPPPLCGRQVARRIANDNSQASPEVQSKIKRYNSLSREWRINMANKKKWWYYRILGTFKLIQVHST